MTLVVAINGLSDSLSNWNTLPPVLEIDGQRVVIHSDPRIDVVDDTIQNFDIVITQHDIIDHKINIYLKWHTLVPEHKLVVKERLDKFTQQIRLRQAAKKDNLKLFQPIKSYFRTKEHPHHIDCRYVVVKPLSGARGIGQFVVDLNTCSIEYLESIIKDINFENITVEEGIDKLKVVNVIYYPGKENSYKEGFKALIDQGLVVQELIKLEDAVEYRLLTLPKGMLIHNQTFAIFPRVFVTDDGHYKQALGGGIGRSEPIDPLTVMPADLVAEISQLMYNIETLNSADLCVSGKGDKFCIYEYSPQFGYNGLPMKLVTDLHIHELSNIIREYLKV